jgi:tetratricopeptide (TPR) repeat protein
MSEMDQLSTRKDGNNKGLYSSKSGNYASYMVARASTKDITNAIQKANNRQMIENAVIGGTVNTSIKRMQTGIQTAINNQTYSIIASQNELKRTMQDGFDSVNNTLDIGFAGVNDAIGNLGASFSAGISDLSWQMGKMTDKICDKLDEIHDIVNNPLLTQSRELYRRAVANYKKGFFEEGLEDIKSAVEKNKTDYLSWFLLGQFYLYGVSEFSNVINITEAIAAFSNAVKYISPDAAEIPEAQKMASEMYFHLAYAEYINANELHLQNNAALCEENLNKAILDNTKSYKLSNTLYEALYQEARCKLLQGKKDEALQLIKQAILGDKNYCLKATADPDFADVVNDIYAMIESLKGEIFPEAKVQYEKLHALMPRVVFGKGQFASYVKGLIGLYYSNIDKFTEELPYFDVRNAYENYQTIYSLITEEKPCDYCIAKIEGHLLDNKIYKLCNDNKFIVCDSTQFGEYNDEPGTIQKIWYEWDAYTGKGIFHDEVLNENCLDSLRLEQKNNLPINYHDNFFGDFFSWKQIGEAWTTKEGKDYRLREYVKAHPSINGKWKIIGKDFRLDKNSDEFSTALYYVTVSEIKSIPEMRIYEQSGIDSSFFSIFFQDAETLFIYGKSDKDKKKEKETGEIGSDYMYVFKPSVWIKQTEEAHNEKVEKENAEIAAKKEAEKVAEAREAQRKASILEEIKHDEKTKKIGLVVGALFSLALTFLLLQIKAAKIPGKFWIILGTMYVMFLICTFIVRLIGKQDKASFILGAIESLGYGLLIAVIPSLLIRFIPFGKSIVSFIIIEIAMAPYLMIGSAKAAENE